MIDRCPFCGSGVLHKGVYYTEFKCYTAVDNDTGDVVENQISGDVERENECFEIEITALKALVGEMGELLTFATDDRLFCERSAKPDCDCGPCQILRVASKILSRPEVKKIMEVLTTLANRS